MVQISYHMGIDFELVVKQINMVITSIQFTSTMEMGTLQL